MNRSDSDQRNRSWWYIRRALRPPGQVLAALVRDLRQGQMDLRAMSLVYSSLLSLAPLLALSFAILKGFGVHNQLEPLLLELLAPLGADATTITRQILEFVGNIRVGVLGAVGLGVLVYTVVSLIQKIVSALEFAWGGHRLARSRRLADYMVILMAGPLLVFAIAGAISGAVESSVMQSLLTNPWLAALYSQLIRWLPLTLLIGVLSFVYWFVPEERVRPLAALTGGIIGGVLWKLTGWAFGAFVVGSGSYTAIYSAFATLMLFIVWLYLNWLILLIGARIAFYVQHPEMMRAGIADKPWLPAEVEHTGLTVMLQVGRAFRDRLPPPTMACLRRGLEVDQLGLSKVLDRLTEQGYLRLDKEDGYLPAAPMKSIRLMDLLATIRGEQSADAERVALNSADEMLFRMRVSLSEQWADVTLETLLTDDDEVSKVLKNRELEAN